jgi:hypothetical protein
MGFQLKGCKAQRDVKPGESITVEYDRETDTKDRVVRGVALAFLP